MVSYRDFLNCSKKSKSCLFFSPRCLQFLRYSNMYNSRIQFFYRHRQLQSTVFYPVPNRIYVRGCCHLYECIWLHFLSIEELTNYSCTKQEYGLVRTYRERQAVYWYIRQLLALPFLPATHIRETFDALRVRANTDPLMRLVDYIDRQWMLNSVFNMPSWSVYGQSVRTNNDVEGRCSFMGLNK